MIIGLYRSAVSYCLTKFAEGFRRHLRRIVKGDNQFEVGEMSFLGEFHGPGDGSEIVGVVAIGCP